jgi:hypothetical protein
MHFCIGCSDALLTYPSQSCHAELADKKAKERNKAGPNGTVIGVAPMSGHGQILFWGICRTIRDF